MKNPCKRVGDAYFLMSLFLCLPTLANIVDTASQKNSFDKQSKYYLSVNNKAGKIFSKNKPQELEKVNEY